MIDARVEEASRRAAERRSAERRIFGQEDVVRNYYVYTIKNDVIFQLRL